MSGSRDLQIAVIYVILTVIFVLVSPLNTTPIRTMLGIPMVLFLPGYALIAALFPRKNDLDGIERLALSFGLSIAVVPLIGLGLNFTPFGIRLVPILLCLSIFILLMCAFSYYRRSKLPPNERFTVPFSITYSSLKEEILSSKSRADKILTVILFISIIISLITLIYVIATPKQGEKFTEFYILGDNGKAEGYPNKLDAGQNISIIVGIVNNEYSPINYTLKILLNEVVLSSMDIQLNHNFTWERKIFFTPVGIGENQKLEFLLYKEENISAPYRDLHLWVNVS